MSATRPSELASAERALGLLWVKLLSLHHRDPGAGDLVALGELCDRIELGVPGYEAYNEHARKLAADLRQCCLAGEIPERAKADALMADADRLRGTLHEAC